MIIFLFWLGTFEFRCWKIFHAFHFQTCHMYLLKIIIVHTEIVNNFYLSIKVCTTKKNYAKYNTSINLCMMFYMIFIIFGFYNVKIEVDLERIRSLFWEGVMSFYGWFSSLWSYWRYVKFNCLCFVEISINYNKILYHKTIYNHKL